MRSCFSYIHFFTYCALALLLALPAYAENETYKKVFDRIPAADPDVAISENVTWNAVSGLKVSGTKSSYADDIVGHWAFESNLELTDSAGNHPTGTVPSTNVVWRDDCLAWWNKW